MKILLLGEYSNMHRTLRDALRRQGHDVLLVSDGDGWKDYPRDITLRRRGPGRWHSLCYVLRLVGLLPRLCGYDVVQLINPDLLHLTPRWNRWFFRFLRLANRRVSVGCYGDDYYVVRRGQADYIQMRQRAAAEGILPPFLEYTDLCVDGQPLDHDLNRQRIAAWCHSGKAALTRYVMSKADVLVACLYEYYLTYLDEEFKTRLHYIPMPIEAPTDAIGRPTDGRVRILLAIQRQRGAMKGTDRMEPLFERLAADYPDRVELLRAESIPFADYCRLLDQADVVVDQLYSYTPAMNALECMRRGKVVVSGGEEAYYTFEEARYAQRQGLNAVTPLRPIVNLRPGRDAENYALISRVLTDRDEVWRLQQQSQAYVRRYHDADVVAQAYLEAWNATATPRR